VARKNAHYGDNEPKFDIDLKLKFHMLYFSVVLHPELIIYTWYLLIICDLKFPESFRFSKDGNTLSIYIYI